MFYNWKYFDLMSTIFAILVFVGAALAVGAIIFCVLGSTMPLDVDTAQEASLETTIPIFPFKDGTYFESNSEYINVLTETSGGYTVTQYSIEKVKIIKNPSEKPRIEEWKCIVQKGLVAKTDALYKLYVPSDTTGEES